MGAIVVKENCMISPDWEGVIEWGFQQSSSWVSLFEIARKLEVRNMKIEIHTGAIVYSKRELHHKSGLRGGKRWGFSAII